ncbi:MAG: cell division protein FtsA [Candidatus Korobacteraceae bacterium]|jgi:cell division protein FtsA
MAKKDENLLTIVDIGTAKTVALVAEVTDAGLRYRGHGVADSRGSRKGIIVDIDKAVASVQKAMGKAEETAETTIERAVAGIAGPHIRAANSQGGIVLGNRPREISREDIRAVVEKVRTIPLPEERHILHLLPQDFILDQQPGIRDPAGMLGRQLEVRVHVITALATAMQNTVTVMNRAGIHVDDTVYEALACSDAVLRTDERELGVCVCDIGAGSTDLIVFHEGVVVHTAVVPIGGDHFTNDVSVGLRTPLGSAETLKCQFGCAVVTSIPESTEIEVPSVGGRPSRLVAQRFLGEVLEPRARELAEMLRDNLRQAGVLELLGAGVVLTGGGARLTGMMETVEDVLRRPARMGLPIPMAKLPSLLAEPEFATAIGMVFYAHRSRVLKTREERGFGARLRWLARSAFGG